MIEMLTKTVTGMLAENRNLAFVLLTGGFLVATIVGGLILRGLSPFISRFFRTNAPTPAQVAKLQALAAAKPAPRPRKPLTPTAEPLVIAGVGFVVFLVLSFVFLRPPHVLEAANAEPAQPAKAALPAKGDFEKIVAELPAGDATKGPQLFSSLGCVGCHSQTKDTRLVGPSFYGLWTRASTRTPPETAKAYIYESIVAPNDHVVETFQPNLMPATFASQMDAQQMADLLAWIEATHNEAD